MIAYWLKRAIEKPANKIVCGAIYLRFRKYFEPKIKGLENLPDESAIIVPNHCIMIDGPALGSVISMRRHKLAHFWIQKEQVYSKRKALLWSIGAIPLEVDSRSTKKAVLKRTYEHLEYDNDYIAIFSEGPTKDLIDEGGRIVPIEQRAHSSSAAHLSVCANVPSPIPIIPVGLRSNDEIERETWKYGIKNEGGALEYIGNYVKQNGRAPYYFNFGKPIFPNKNLGKKEAIIDLTARVKDEVCRLARTARD